MSTQEEAAAIRAELVRIGKAGFALPQVPLGTVRVGAYVATGDGRFWTVLKTGGLRAVTRDTVNTSTPAVTPAVISKPDPDMPVREIPAEMVVETAALFRRIDALLLTVEQVWSGNYPK